MGLELAFLILGLAGLALFGLGLRRIWQWRLTRGGIQGLIGALLLSAALLLASLSANLHTYQRLSHETPVARLRFEQLGAQHFRAYLARPGHSAAVYELYGDEWQVDARVLKWHGAATLLGFDSGYQLERLGGRYRDLQQEQTARRSVYTLYKGTGIDIWALARRHPDWLPWVDAVYGSATYLPMAHGARFAIRMGQSGLIARPLNDAAQAAVENWQ